MTSKATLTCMGLDCPERKSVCCGAVSKAVSGDEGTGYYACSKCGGEFIGGNCNADKSFFDYSLKEKKEILDKAGKDAQKMMQETMEKGKIALFLNKYPEVRWDRYTDDGKELCFYGWIERKDGKYDYLELAFDHKGNKKWYSTSSAYYSRDFAKRGGFTHNSCLRVEDLFGDTVNAIRLPTSPAKGEWEKPFDENGDYLWVKDLKKLMMVDDNEIIKYTGGFRVLVGFIRSIEASTRSQAYEEGRGEGIVEGEKRGLHDGIYGNAVKGKV